MNVTRSEDIIIVTWRYRFPDCRSFTVHVNQKPVRGCSNITVMTCTVRNFIAGQQNEITVFADSDERIESSPYVIPPTVPSSQNGMR